MNDGLSEEAAETRAEAGHNHPADAHLLAQLASESLPHAAHQQALESLIERWDKQLYAFAFGMTRDGPASEEIVQDVFVALWVAVVRKRRPITHLKSWLYKVASRHAAQVVHSRRSASLLQEHVEDAAAPEAPGDQVAEVREDRDALYRLVRELPEALRLPVLLHYGAGHSQVEIASMLDCGQATVSERLKRALERLRSEMLRLGYSSPAALPLLLHDSITAPSAQWLPAGRIVTSARIARHLVSSRTIGGMGLKTFLAVAGLMMLGVATGLVVVFAPNANAPNAGQAVRANSLRWTFDTELPAGLQTCDTFDACLGNDAFQLREAHRAWDGRPGGARWTASGKSGGALSLSQCRGVVLPIAATDPLAVSFALNTSRPWSAGVLAWPAKTVLQSQDVRSMVIPVEPPVLIQTDTWRNVLVVAWPDSKCWTVARYENGVLCGVDRFEADGSGECRLFIGAVQATLDDVRVDAPTAEVLARSVADARDAFAKPAGQPDAMRGWTPLAENELVIPGNPTGVITTTAGKDGAVYTFEPQDGRAQSMATYAYLGANRTESFEVRGVLEIGDGRDTLPFELGLVHPNRFNFASHVWNLERPPLPILFRTQVWLDAKGVRMSTVLWNMDGWQSANAGSPAWVPEPWKGYRTGQVHWLKLADMKNCGFGIAAYDALRFRNIEFRPLSSHALLVPLED